MIGNEFHKAWLLHRRSYKERSVIAEFLVAGHGRVAIVVRGVRQSKSRLASLLQPFHQVLVRWKGRSELKTLVDLELDRFTFLTGERLYCGFYANELLMRSMIPGQLVDGVTDLYRDLLAHLHQNVPLEPLLRSFELDLLELCGYAPPLDWDVFSGAPLKEGMVYRFEPEHGLVPTHGQVSYHERAFCYTTELLQALSARDFTNADFYPGFKRFTRQAMKPLIGDRPMQSRMLFTSRKPQTPPERPLVENGALSKPR
ncbi:DNA repair protein RecO [Endozoicomonas sp. GU-1]|uniref:DNA repair protein RecO n=1 Tax=Endozoicomonas sp. GU-1 TaxID=3009078 RepID=UPI0022B55256|nr:DNA repair protein RecO [Endozoicomonas sp. GU-1]WBA83638.1 DNA repair protein RecO [Endozoicomonas sp. GU-1]WBA86616.1 DNA repair protein RecO [Endozoicomonas sp. GU-1]